MRIHIALLACVCALSNAMAESNGEKPFKPIVFDGPTKEKAQAKKANVEGGKEVVKEAPKVEASASASVSKQAATATKEAAAREDLAAKVAVKMAEARKAAQARARARIAAKAAHVQRVELTEHAITEKRAVPASAHVSHALHWDYEGEGGPLRWGRLNPAWSVCENGLRQSPIDIRDGIRVELEPVNVDYKPSRFSVLDNGHTIQVNMGPGNYIRVMGRMFELVQFHFHRPSEERVNGRGFQMVAHLVHKDADGKLAVIAVLIEEGQANSVVQSVWNNLPLEKNEALSPSVVMDLNQLLPARRDYYTYMGSLTTPPCSEGVLWIVFKEPIQLSSQQIGIFARLYPMNARPIQAPSGRLIKESN